MTTPEPRAGGTDLSERRRSGVSRGAVVDLTVHPDATLHDCTGDEHGWSVGSLCTLDAIAHHPGLVAAYPGLTVTAGALATPQVRRTATLGGNLLQHTRCWYYRNPAVSCLKKPGGTGCPARDGNHLYGVAVDLGPCVWPHPSSVAAALLAYRAAAEIESAAGTRRTEPLATLYDADAARDHTLAPGEVLTRVLLPAPVAGERAGYYRSTSRAHAEWPLVEAVVALTLEDGRIGTARLGLGGLANVPLLAEPLESALAGVDPLASGEVLAAAAEGFSRLARGVGALRDTAYKRDLVAPTVLEAVRRAVAAVGE